MKFFSTPTIGLGGLTLAASLALFSSGASAVTIDSCVFENDICGQGISDEIALAGTNDFEFEITAGGPLPVSVGSISLTVELFILGDGLIDISNAYLTLDSNDVFGPVSVTPSSLSGDVDGVVESFTATWDVATASDVNDFHFDCSDSGSGLCSTTFIASYLFELTPRNEPPAVPAPAAAPLLLLGLAVTALGAALRRRPVRVAAC